MRKGRHVSAILLTVALFLLGPAALAASPIKVGFSMALTGSVAQNGKQLIIALELWRRPVELVYYDDQSNPTNVPGIYTKLITVDNVDLLLGPYATNMAAAAMPVIMQHNTSADGTRENATAGGFKIIYDQSYPPSTTDFAPVMRAVQAANPDIVFVAAYPPDTVGIVRAAAEIGLTPKMFGGTMIGLLITPIKTQLGPLLDGIVIMESFVPAPSFNFPGVTDVLKRYRAKAAGEKIDPIGYGFVPFGYAAGQVLAQAVETTKSLDHARLADYIHHHTFYTVVGEINYAADGAWAQSRTLLTQFQKVAAGNIDQFRDGGVQPILWPPQYKSGTMIYPYAAAKK